MKLRNYLDLRLKVHFLSNSCTQITNHWIHFMYLFYIWRKASRLRKNVELSLWNIFQAAFVSVLISFLLSMECIDGELRAAVCESCWSTKEHSPCAIPGQICLAQRADNELWAERIWLKCQSTQSPVEFPQKRLLQHRIVLTKESCCVKFAATPCDELPHTRLRKIPVPTWIMRH